MFCYFIHLIPDVAQMKGEIVGPRADEGTYAKSILH